MGRPAPASRTPGQNRAIWGLMSQLARASGLDREELDPTLRRIVREVSGQEHTSQLSASQAQSVVRKLELELAAYAKPAPAPRPASRPHEPWGERGEEPRDVARITPAQQVMITGLFRLLGKSRQEQVGFSQRQCKKPWPQTFEDADKLIEPLKAMLKRQVRPREIWARFQALDGNPSLNTFERGFVADLCRQYTEADQVGRLDRVLTPGRLQKLLEIEQRLGVE